MNVFEYISLCFVSNTLSIARTFENLSLLLLPKHVREAFITDFQEVFRALGCKFFIKHLACKYFLSLWFWFAYHSVRGVFRGAAVLNLR